MKKGISREVFQEDIIKVIYSVTDRSIVNKITKELIENKGVERGLASDIMQGNAQYSMLSLVELGAILDAIYKITKMPVARIDKYLELAEINQVRSFKYHRVSKKQSRDLLVFEDVRQVARDIWTVVVPAKRIVDLYRANKITYNPETQRDPKLIKSGDTIISTINVNASSVESIREDLVNSVFIPNTITFNVPINEESSIKYDQRRNRLVIVGGSIDILDGYHRSAGIVAASRQLGGHLDYNFELRITNFNVEKARRYIVQEDKRNSISKEYIKSIDTTDYISNIVNDINEGGRSEMRGLIVTDYDLVRAGRGVITFDLMHLIVGRLWEPKSVIEAENIAEYLTNFFNRLIFNLSDIKTKQHNVKYDHTSSSSNMAFYLVLAKQIEGDESWKSTLSSLLQKLNIKNGINEELKDYNMSSIKRHTGKFITLCKETVEEAK